MTREITNYMEFVTTNYALIRSFETYPIDNTIVVGLGDVEIDMCEDAIVGISINSTNVIRNIGSSNECIVVKMETNMYNTNICSLDKVACGRAQVFVYRNENDEILQIVIYEACEANMLSADLARLSILSSTHSLAT